jgi:hypothetical protein
VDRTHRLSEFTALREASARVTNKDNFVSIVAVHGLNGDGNKSFRTDDKKFWLGDEDMLPHDIAKSRVLIFNYPASVTAIFGRTSSDTVLQHATTLVQELSADRQVRALNHILFLVFLRLADYLKLEKATERPIIFLCHSLGGIIVKRVRNF